MIALRFRATATNTTWVRCPPLGQPFGWTLAALLHVSAGCAPAPTMPAAPPPPPPSEPNVLSVAELEPVSDVADLTEAVRHVLSPVGLLSAPPPASPPTPADTSGSASAVHTTDPATNAMAAFESVTGPVGATAETTAPARSTGGTDDPTHHDVPAAAADSASDPSSGLDAEVEIASLTGATSSHEPVRAEGLEPGAAPQDAILAAWEHYCVSTDLTPEQWGIIDRTSMPASMEANWASRCRPEK